MTWLAQWLERMGAELGPQIGVAVIGFITALGAILIRRLDPETRRAIRKDAIQEWRDIADALEKRVGKAEADSISATIAAAAAKKEAEDVKAAAAIEREETAKRRAEQDKAIGDLTIQVDDLTKQLNERSSMAAQREQELEKQVGILQGYVKQLTNIMEANGLEVPPMPDGVKVKRRRRKVARKVEKESGGGE